MSTHTKKPNDTKNEEIGLTPVTLSAPKGGRTNYLEWLDYAVDVFGPKYGKLASVLKTHAPYEVPRVTPADWAIIANDDEDDEEDFEDDIEFTDANRRELKLRAYAARIAEVRELQKDKPKFFYALWAMMSIESRQLVTAQEDFAAANANEDPNELLRIIRVTHHTNMNGGGNATQALEDLMRKQQEFALFRQRPSQSIATFKKQFTDTCCQTLVSMGATPYEENALAMLFLMKLDSARHGSMMLELKNQASRGIAYPTTLEEAYNLASNWHSSVTYSKGDPGRGDSNLHTIFVLSDNVVGTRTNPSHDGKGKQDTKANRGGGNNNKSKPSKAADEGTDKSNADKRSNTAKGKHVTFSPTANKNRSRKCYACGSVDHIVSECPYNTYRAQNVNLVVSEAIGAVDSCDEEDDDNDDVSEDDDYLFGCGNSTTNMVVCDELFPTEEHNNHTILAAARSGQFGDNVIMMDCAAGVSLFRNAGLLHDVESIKCGSVAGVNKDAPGLKISKKGQFSDIGEVAQSDGAVANILSQAQMVERGHRVSYDSDEDEYTLTTPRHIRVFSRKLLPEGYKSRFYTHILVNTVQDNLRRYTTREVNQAKKAKELQRRLGFPSARSTIQILSKGIVNCDVTTADVRNADAIYGTSVAALKGKTKKRSSSIATPILAPRVTQVQQTMQVDVMFVKEIPFLIAVFSPLGLTVCSHLKDRGIHSVGRALKSFIGHAHSRNFDIQEIRVDGEGALAALAVQLQSTEGVTVIPAGPGEHVPVVERMIQTVKGRVRAHENTLPYVMPKHIIIGCVLAMVRNINLQPNIQSLDGVSPLEQYTGIKLDAKRDLRCGCGDYVQARVPVTDNTMKSRTDGCITLYPSGNTTGSVVMLKLSTMQTVVRDQFQVLPMPDEVINFLTQTAARQGYTRGKVEPLPMNAVPADTILENEDANHDDDGAGDNNLPPLPTMQHIGDNSSIPVDVMPPTSA